MKSYELMTANIAAIEKMGTWIAKSQMFGCGSVDQGCVIAMDCFITGMPLMEYQKRNMLVQGRPSIPYDAMIAAFQEAGGKIKVVEKSPDAARIELTFDGSTTPFEFTWEQALKEPLPYNGKEKDILAMLASGKKPPLKAKYATPRSRAVMLYARVVSDGIRTVAASVNFGAYTPEEISDFDELQSEATSAPTAVATESANQSKPTDQHQPAETSAAVASPEPAKQAEPEDDRAAMRTSERAKEDQRQEVISLMKELAQTGYPDIGKTVTGRLEAAGIQGGILGLTYEEAANLIKALQHKQIDAWAETALVGFKGTDSGKA